MQLFGNASHDFSSVAHSLVARCHVGVLGEHHHATSVSVCRQFTAQHHTGAGETALGVHRHAGGSGLSQHDDEIERVVLDTEIRGTCDEPTGEQRHD